MRTRYNKQLEQLNNMLIEMGQLCSKAIEYAADAIDEDSEQLRKLTYETDSLVDDMEREIESLCMKLLLHQQPVASDLRLISSALKMISDMERIGDQAYDIAELTEYISPESRSFCQEDIDVITETAIKMVDESVASFVKKDLDMAKHVIDMDDVADDAFANVKQDLIDAISKDRDNGEALIDILMVAKYLERICDHAENVAEWVIFSITGQHEVSEK